jgi:hypothetical protein
VSQAFPSWKRSILTEIYLCHACSYHEIEDGNARAGEWPWEVALALAAPSDELVLGDGDYELPPGWWCRLKHIRGQATGGCAERVAVFLRHARRVTAG